MDDKTSYNRVFRCSRGSVQSFEQRFGKEGEFAFHRAARNGDVECVAINPSGCRKAVDGRSDYFGPCVADAVCLVGYGTSGCSDGLVYQFSYLDGVAAFHVVLKCPLLTVHRPWDPG